VKNQNDPMGDRMKRYEAATQLLLPRRTYTILRLDGRAFHTVTRSLGKPFSKSFSDDMIELTKQLCAEVSGSVFAYTQSDEISILMRDFATINAEPWFGGNVQKIVSVAASLAGSLFPHAKAHFDARVFTIPEPVEVANYFIWRQRDCARNAVLAYAQHQFGQKAIQNLDTGKLIHLLEQDGIAIPTVYSNGTIVDKDFKIIHEQDKRYGTWRSFWTSFVAPPLSCEPGSYLAKAIPPLPTLSADVNMAQNNQDKEGDTSPDPTVPEAKVQAKALSDAHGDGDEAKDDRNK
jgi:tRNA(His) guanylyltransferase